MLDDSLSPKDRVVFDLAFARLGLGPEDAGELAGALRAELLESELLADVLLGDAETDEVDEDTLVELLVDILTTTDRFWITPAEMIWRADVLLEGVVVTHRLSERELIEGVLEICPDTEMIDFDIDHDEDLLIDGQVVAFDFDLGAGWHVWSLPDGLPAGLQAGDLIGLRRDGRVLTIEHGDTFEAAAMTATDDVAVLAAVGETLAQVAARGIGMEATQIVMGMLADHPDLLRTPTVPLTELLEAAGASRKGDFFGPADVEWELPGAGMARQIRQDLFRRWQFDDCCDDAFELAYSSWIAHVAGRPSAHENGEVRRALAHGSVSLALIEFVGPMANPGPWEQWLTPLTDSVRRDAAPALYLLAQVLEDAGRVIEAESRFEQAALADAEFLPSLEALGVLAFERGDFARAVSLLGRTSAPGRTHPIAEMIDYLAPSIEGVGRNEPCPCGSGRKFKSCHRGKPFHPDGEVHTAKLLLHKAMAHLGRRQAHVRDGLLWALDDDADERVGYDDLVGDIALFETGVFERFFAARTEILPPEEVAEGRRWIDTPRRLFEVVGVEQGEWLELLEITSGETHHVIERSGSAGVEAGEYLLMRVVLPDADADRASDEGPAAIGVVTRVPMQARESLIEVLDDGADPHALVHWWSRVTAPPELRNRHGHDLVFCELTIDPGVGVGVGETRAALDALCGADGSPDGAIEDVSDDATDGARVWRASQPLREGSDEMVIVASIEMVDGVDGVDGRLQASTNSEERAEELLSELAAVLPEMKVVTDVRTPFDEVPRDGGGEGVGDAGEGDWDGSGMIDPADASPEVQAAMREYMRKYEESWLDESLPALDGMTPREAVADPTRRDDVERLLAGFVPRDDDFGMDPQRIRELLGLD